MTVQLFNCFFGKAIPLSGIQKHIEPVCEAECINIRKVKKVRKKLPAPEIAGRMAEMFKAFADQTRLNIVLALMNEELCVCDIANLLSASKSLVSHQLRILRNLRLVKFRKEKKMVFYSLDDAHIKEILEIALLHIHEREGKI